MTFCSEEQNIEEIVNKVEINEDNCKIIYMDRNKEIVNINDINILKELEEKMLRQSEERNDLENINSYIHKYGSLIVWIASTGLLVKSCILSKNFLLICIAFMIMVYYMLKFKDYSERINELKKYKILLKNYKEIKDKLHVNELFDFGNEKIIPIDIFNIDQYTLKEVKAIKKELKRISKDK